MSANPEFYKQVGRPVLSASEKAIHPSAPPEATPLVFLKSMKSWPTVLTIHPANFALGLLLSETVLETASYLAITSLTIFL